ncbi:MAG: MlaD family protein [Steroidobacteraceae bacterium]
MSNARLAVIGLFVVCGVALAVFTIISFGDVHPFHHGQSADIVFSGSVSGLEVGAPVTFRGVPVGKVSAITIEYDPKPRQAYVRVQVMLQEDRVASFTNSAGPRPSMARWVAAGLKAQLVPMSLISGQSEINLDFIPSEPASLHPEITDQPEIPAARGTSGPVAQQLSKLDLEKLAQDADLTLRSVQRLTGLLSRTLPPFLQSATRSSIKAGQALDAAKGTMNQLVARVSATLSSVNRLTTMGTRQLDGRGADLHALLVSSNQAVLQARDALRNVRGMTDIQSPARANLEETLRDLSAASASLRGATADIEQDPALLLRGRRR